jgi:hypothetical protein
MASTTFDQLTKRFSRRWIAKGLLAGGVAGTAALLGTRQSQAVPPACANWGKYCRESFCLTLKGSPDFHGCVKACLERNGC